MFTVKKKPLTPNMIWDAEAGKPLCKFVKGQLTTNDETLLEKLTALGCEVSGEADKAPDTDAEVKEPEQAETPTEGDDSSTGSESDETPDTDAEAPATTTSTTGTGKRRSRK